MDIEEDDDVPLVLGRPFMETARMMIDIDDGLMEVNFDIFESMKHSKDKGTCFKVDAMDEAIMDVSK